MSQHDYIISNDTGANVRSDLNNALGAIATVNSGATEPSTTYAYQLWMDTANNVLKMRNSANSAWYTLPISPVANNTVDINGGTIDGVTIGGASAPTVTNLGSVATCDINGGTIDGVTIGASSAPTVTNLGSVATCDINGGTIDGATIGGSSAAAVTGTTVTATGLMTAQDGLVVDNDGAAVATFDRATSDGTIAEFQKDGSAVGSIGTNGGDLFISNSDTGLRYRGVEDNIIPCDGSGSSRDNAVSLGGSSYRFKDLYLSGGIYLGGTGAANYLDDYEEGTWTPTAVGSTTAGTTTYSNQQGRYTKIGRLVTCQFDLDQSAMTGTGELRIGGLPFTSSSTAEDIGSAMTNYWDYAAGRTSIALYLLSNSTQLILFASGSGVSWDVVQAANGTRGVRGTISYQIS